MEYQVEEKFGKWIIVQTEQPFEQVGPSFSDKKTAEEQLRRLKQGKK
jgi:hypothetical protein